MSDHIKKCPIPTGMRGLCTIGVIFSFFFELEQEQKKKIRGVLAKLIRKINAYVALLK